jgi:GT2 family glycosyltransferase
VSEHEKPTVIAVVAGSEDAVAVHACVSALASQTTTPDAVLVVADADAADAVRTALPSAELVGAAAGTRSAERFRAGVQRAYDRRPDWIWLVRDDGVPDRSALECLLTASRAVPELEPPVLLASKPVTRAGAIDEQRLALAHYKRIEQAVYTYAQGLQPIRWVDFGSVLVTREAMDAHGMPSADYRGRDAEIEFTARLMRDDLGFLAPRSVFRTGPPAAVAELGVAEYLVDSLRMLRSGSWRLGESVGLAVGRGLGAIARGRSARRREPAGAVEAPLRP